MLRPVENTEEVYVSLETVQDSINYLVEYKGANNRQEMLEDLDECMAHLHTIRSYLSSEVNEEIV